MFPWKQATRFANPSGTNATVYGNGVFYFFTLQREEREFYARREADHLLLEVRPAWNNDDLTCISSIQCQENKVLLYSPPNIFSTCSDSFEHSETYKSVVSCDLSFGGATMKWIAQSLVLSCGNECKILDLESLEILWRWFYDPDDRWVGDPGDLLASTGDKTNLYLAFEKKSDTVVQRMDLRTGEWASEFRLSAAQFDILDMHLQNNCLHVAHTQGFSVLSLQGEPQGFFPAQVSSVSQVGDLLMTTGVDTTLWRWKK